MSFEYDSISKETFPNQIAKQIRAAILRGELSIDQRLPSEDDLAAQFKVSRPTIREALKRLAAQNLIRSRRGPSGGNFVMGPSMHEAREDLAAMTTMLVSVGDISIAAFAECRLELECLCARIAAVHRTDSDLGKLAAEIEIQRDINLTDEQFCATDVRFHRALVDATKNDLLRFLMSGVVEALQPISNLIVFRFRERKEIVSQHQRIIEFLARRDGEGAANVLVDQARYLNSHYSNAIAARERRVAGGGSQIAESVNAPPKA